MRMNKPVIVYVGDDDRASEFMERTGTYVLGAPTTDIAISQIFFSSPDAIVIDALLENMDAAKAVYKQLRSIQHIPTVVLSDEPERWDLLGRQGTRIVAHGASDQRIIDALGMPLSVPTPIAS